jgi:hypothetical protein
MSLNQAVVSRQLKQNMKKAIDNEPPIESTIPDNAIRIMITCYYHDVQAIIARHLRFDIITIIEAKKRGKDYLDIITSWVEQIGAKTQ